MITTERLEMELENIERYVKWIEIKHETKIINDEMYKAKLLITTAEQTMIKALIKESKENDGKEGK